jgi:acetylornithine/N-succinyldiaminopimelate aminotransferase
MRHQDRAAAFLCQWPSERYRIITIEGAFHGRTLATIAAGGQPKYLEGFGPKVEGFDQVPFGRS